MAYRAFSAAAICLVILVGCGDTGSTARPPFVLPTGGTGGLGTGGSGATGGVGGTGGSGATGGSGGAAATGGSGATGGTGATGGNPGPCMTNALCRACPSQFLCDSDNDCFEGWGCIPSGCETLGGAPINQCEPMPGGFCTGDDDCPSPSAPDPDYTCESVPLEGMRCVKQTPGCNSDSDCVRGFSCEAGGCVDRRVPCVLDDDCPVSYSCEMPTSNRFCIRIYETCESDLDCGILAQYCEDIDGDGTKECAGALGLNGPACLNSSCGGSTPVCEASGVGSISSCGQYGLCQDVGDCADSTFECLSLWQDGRKECVKKNGTCDHITECPVNQVCAAARTGGAPACQAGAVN